MSLPETQSIEHILNWCGIIIDCATHRDTFYSRPTGQKIFYWMYAGPTQRVTIQRSAGPIEIEAIRVRDEDYEWAIDTFDELDYYLEPEFVLTEDINQADLRLWGTSGYNLMSETSTLFGFATPFNANEKGYVDVVVNVDAGIASGDNDEFDPENTHTALHEIGHALGLSHPGIPGRDLPEWDLYDSEDTIMSYNHPEDGIHAMSYSEGDLYALIEIWGAEGDYTDNPEPTIDNQTDPEIIYSMSGKGKLKGRKNVATAFVFDTPDRFGKKGADQITNFNPDTGDMIFFTPNSLPGLDDRDEFYFAVAKRKKRLKKLSKECYDFVYFEPKGQLFYDDNCNRKGWGNSNDGGLVLTLKNKPKLTVEHLGFGEILA